MAFRSQGYLPLPTFRRACIIDAGSELAAAHVTRKSAWSWLWLWIAVYSYRAIFFHGCLYLVKVSDWHHLAVIQRGEISDFSPDVLTDCFLESCGVENYLA